MKKRILMGLLCWMLLGVPLPALAQEEPPEGFTGIYTRQELEAIADNPEGSYALMADINLADAPWYPIPFSGIFEGNGHTLYNIEITQLNGEAATSVDGNYKEYETYFAAFFSHARKAEIRSLNLLNVEASITTDGNAFVAGLVGYAEDALLDNCSVQGRIHLAMRDKMCGVAGLIGFGYGVITGCETDVELVLVDENRDLKCEEFLGGAIACGYGDIQDSTIRVRGYTSVHGYVHNGGVVGMYHIHTDDRKRRGALTGTEVDAEIYFFENNRDRRAYCKPFIGELLRASVTQSGNTQLNYVGKEYKTFDVNLLPDMCETPDYDAAVTPPTCTELGFTTYTCKTCGYTYNDLYTSPQHTMGEWEVVEQADYTHPGLRARVCTLCGEGREEEEIPQLEEPPPPPPALAETCELNAYDLNLPYKGQAQLAARVLPEDAENRDVIWSAGDTSVATVDAQGNVVATGRGVTMITCTSADGNASAQCRVIVKYAWWQWVVEVLLFGWIWY